MITIAINSTIKIYFYYRNLLVVFGDTSLIFSMLLILWLSIIKDLERVRAFYCSNGIA